MAESYKEAYRKIEISFAEKVDLPQAAMKEINEAIDKICTRYTTMNPGRLMWPFGIGFKVTYMPMTAEEEAAGRTMEFDEDTFAIDCAEREDYDWLCAKCGVKQGDHASCISGGVQCDFQAQVKQ